MKRYEEYLNKIGVVLSDSQIEQFNKFYEMLIEKNKVMNLTGITEYDEVVEKHFIDSLAIGAFDKIEGKIIDIGTGAGFPGIPLKIAFPEIEIVLLDSLNKRIKFLDEVIDELGLEKIETIHGRAEDYAQQLKYREEFDFCVSRAVANLSTLSEYCLPFVKINGKFISYKSGEINDELVASRRAIELLGGNIIEVNKFELPNSTGSRSAVVINKIKKTEKKYPRKAGLPAKEPI
ncbi:MAG: 16S rRNA (guanine(527)-N(7))-methyltransferase RsmG [Eubacteriales bacterium]